MKRSQNARLAIKSSTLQNTLIEMQNLKIKLRMAKQEPYHNRIRKEEDQLEE